MLLKVLLLLLARTCCSLTDLPIGNGIPQLVIVCVHVLMVVGGNIRLLLGSLTLCCLLSLVRLTWFNVLQEEGEPRCSPPPHDCLPACVSRTFQQWVVSFCADWAMW